MAVESDHFQVGGPGEHPKNAKWFGALIEAGRASPDLVPRERCYADATKG